MGIHDENFSDTELGFLEAWQELGKLDDDTLTPEDNEPDTDHDYGHDDDYEGDDEDVIGIGGSQIGDEDENSDEGESNDSESDQSELDIENLNQDSEDEGLGGGGDSSDQAEEKDHLESGDSDSEIEDNESELEHDQLDDDDENQNEAEDDESEDNDQLDLDSILDDILNESGGDKTDEKIQEDDGEGERADSDEQRESDEKIDSDSDNQSESESEGEGESDLDTENESGRPQGCDDHCEDNEPEGDDAEPCPHCNKRIADDREKWGQVASDRNGAALLPGDKIKVVIPVSFFAHEAILTVNVPHEDSNRIAVKTNGVEHPEYGWLSGRGISELTGWHMKDDGPIWTFSPSEKPKLKFAVKVGEAFDWKKQGDEMIGDIEDFLEDLLENDKHDQELQNEQIEEDQEEKSEDNQKGEEENEVGLTKTQMSRFENLTDRIDKKVQGTFGNTMESHNIDDTEILSPGVVKYITIESRGVKYTIAIGAQRKS